MSDILCIVAGLTVLGFVVGIPYVKGAKKQCNKNPNNNKRNYVISNLHKFRPTENGSSFKNKKIHLVSCKKIGL